ncbi:sigma 54-interacting transcriptional regulator [Methylosinus sp. LW3]|uniref:sigma-54-dependent Fis family transcriptional regulator n=1 Tax=Methylosinus sp. LW3 TaxID=107635 RepID=UPI001FD8DBB8|nr:sigma 54-interacting transcriptional regulator [Methylosinus sp. LW3]
MRSPLLGHAAASVIEMRSAEETGFYGVDRPGVAWDWMKQTGQAPAGADWVRPQVAEAWARCVDDHALPPGAEFAPRQRRDDRDATELDAWRNSVGGVAGRLSALVYELRALLAETNVALLLADPAGALVQLLDSGSRITSGAAQMARIGADWSEASLGNNGVGTASLLRTPIAFDGKEHFNGALHRFATAGCPITAPDGSLCAILGMVSDRRDAAKLALGFLEIARLLLEASLFDRIASDGYLLRLRATRDAEPRFADEGRIFIGADGLVRGVDRAGVETLRSDHPALIGQHAATALGVDLPALVAAHESARLIPLADPRNQFSVFAEAHRCPKRESYSTSPRRAPDRADAAPRAPEARADWSDNVLEAALRKASGLQERNIPILITGESGVGKDHLVRRLHAGGPRKERPLVAINCAAIPRELIESELFGYEGGSFTGARAKGKAGKFVEADKGILFLDEIGDMAADLQATLLRVLDSSEVVPIGSSKPIRVDVRVVAATNRSLQEMVQKGTFRRDLYYRLNGVQLWLPPLRERPDRLGLLAQLFRLEREALAAPEELRFCDEVWRIFFKHPWPGNIREARNVLRSSIAVAKGPLIEIDDLPIDFIQELDFDNRNVGGAPPPAAIIDEAVESEAGFDLSDWEARAVRHALASAKGNIAKAARSLGITRATLYHKMARYGLRSDRRIVCKR